MPDRDAGPFDRTVYFVSDGTGITAETLGHSVLTQFGDLRYRPQRLPFVDSVEKARDAALRTTLLTGIDQRLSPARLQDLGLAWAQSTAGLWGVQGGDLTVLQLQKGQLRSTLRLGQTAMVAGQRMPVLQRGLALTIDAEGQVLSVVAEVMPIGKLGPQRIERGQAQKTAVKAALGLRDDRGVPVDRVHRCELAILAGPGEARLVWAVDVVVNPATDRRAVLVDAESGVILGQRQAAQH